MSCLFNYCGMMILVYCDMMGTSTIENLYEYGAPNVY